MVKKNQESATKVPDGIGLNGTQERPSTRSNNADKGKSTISRPRNQAQRVKKESTNSAPSNQISRVRKEPAANSRPTNQAQLVIKETPNSAGTSYQTQLVMKGTENASTEQKNYMRKTESFSAKEKGKAKVEEVAAKAVKRQKREAEVRPTRIIRWKGICIICERDLSSSPDNDDTGYDDDDEDYGYDYFETKNLPEIGVLGCSHCYHDKCLDSITPHDLTADPPCLICLS